MLWRAGQLNKLQEGDRFCLFSPTREAGKSLKQQERWEIHKYRHPDQRHVSSDPAVLNGKDDGGPHG